MDPTEATENHQGQHQVYNTTSRQRDSLSSKSSTCISSPIDNRSESNLATRNPHAEAVGSSLPRRSQEDIVIAVMGKTGSGKSRFISKLSSRDYADLTRRNLGIDPFLLQEVKCNVQRYRVLMVDTPGFGDTSGGDSVILDNVEGWLRGLYHDGKSLVRLINIHDITGPPTARLPAMSLKRLRRLLKTISGTNTWKGMTADGATVMRYYDATESAERVIRNILDKHIPNKRVSENAHELDRGSNAMAASSGDAEEENQLRKFPNVSTEIRESRERLARLEIQLQKQQDRLEEYRLAEVRVASALVTIMVVLNLTSKLRGL
ncbi:hypothetical protein F5Y11DRAFT_344402 [Daldinia sp. FL1419]|nr:hypothetical protein F5Y11DRAFT_344402 [Daldinia sp. FL1419]